MTEPVSTSKAGPGARGALGASFWPIALYAALAVLVVPVFPHFMSPNEFSRWVVAVAVVEFQTVEVTPVIQTTGIPIDDLSSVEGRLYSNKAPGAALVGLPAYVLARAIVGPPSPQTMRTTINAMRLVAATLPTLFLAFWLHVVARRLGCTEDRARTGVVVLLFATPLLAYGLLYFAHALSALTLFGPWALLFVSPQTVRNQILAGALIGLAVLSEYPSAIPAAVILICALPLLRVRGTLAVMAGGAPFALLLAIYNKIAFGSVFSLSSGREAAANLRALAESGLFGVGLPRAEYLIGLLADPSKGLFVLSPVLLLAVAGIAPARRAMSLPAFIALLATPLSILLTIAGYPNWFGGWTVGARYLVAALPFLALLVSMARRFWIESLLLGASVAAMAAVSLTFPFIPPEYPAPWVTFAWPILRDGFVMPNLFHFVWRPLAIAVPFLMVTVAAALAVPRRQIALLFVGAAIWFAAGFIGAAAWQRDNVPYIRAMVEEVHFGKEGAIARDLPPGPQRTAIESIARSANAIPPPGWPF